MAETTDINAEARALRPQLVAWRRDFHAHPELGFQEHRSAGLIAGHLRDLGYEVQTGVAQTGVVGLLAGPDLGPTVMVRVDMDALPILEENDVAYVSQQPGVMHACGHDAHMAIGLGLATLAARHRREMRGSLKLIFQPAEEGLGGAEAMVEAGVLADPRPDIFLSGHVISPMPLGTIAATPGGVMAAADKWTCTIRGVGGHGAMPDLSVDPTVAAAQIITALQTIVSRNVSPLDTAVVSVGMMKAGEAFNVIPPRVELAGTIRTFEPAVREMVLRRLREVVEGVARAYGATAEIDITPATPPVWNDAAVTEVVRAAAAAVVGAENVTDLRTMGSEDAAFFMQDLPGCFCFLGAANAERGIDAPHHNPAFDVDEDVLPLGVATLMHALAHYLS